MGEVNPNVLQQIYGLKNHGMYKHIYTIADIRKYHAVISNLGRLEVCLAGGNKSEIEGKI